MTILITDQTDKTNALAAALNCKITDIETVIIQSLPQNQISLKKSASLIVVDSAIDGYYLDDMPDFLQTIRKQINSDTPIILTHPSRVHPDDRALFKSTDLGCFKVLQRLKISRDGFGDIQNLVDGFANE